MFASGAEQGVAVAGGARPTATMSPIAVADAIDTDTIRRNADNVTPFQGQDVALTSAVGPCDDSDLRGSCDQ
jgi:hypothetical protein